MKVKLIAIFTLFLFVVCGKNELEKNYENYSCFSKFSITEKCTIKEFCDNKFKTFLGAMSLVNDKYLIVFTLDHKNKVKIFNIDTKKLIKQFGEIGSGPGEYTTVMDILVDNKEFSIINQHSINCYNDIDKVVFEDQLLPDTVFNLCLEAGLPGRTSILAHDTLVSFVAGSEHCLGFYDNDKLIRKSGYMPCMISNYKQVFSYLMPTRLVKNVDVRKIAFGDRFCDVLQIFDYEGNNIKTIHGPDLITPAWLSKDNSIYGYGDLASTSKVLYCSYSGISEERQGDWLASYGKSILVFDWDGNPIKRIETNFPIAQIVVSEKKNRLFVEYFDGEHIRIGYIEL